MKPEETVSVRVTHRFAASAERVFDAWLDPSKVCKFLFATATGQIVRADIDARVGGRFTIVDRRNGEDVEHVGTYVAIERPRRLVFDLSVPKYSSDESRVEIEIQPLAHGCELTLVQHMPGRYADVKGRSQDGWRRILGMLEEIVPAAEPSCGAGLAQHATVPTKIAPMFAALATLGFVVLVAMRVIVPVVRTDDPRSPVSALAHLPTDMRQGRVLNDYSFSGYLIWTGIKVFIDSRADFYGDNSVKNYAAIAAGDRDALAESLSHSRARWTIFATGTVMAKLMDGMPEWRRVYIDKLAVIHVHD